MLEKTKFIKNVMLSLYIYYMLNNFKTTYYIHHPFETWDQNKGLTSYLKHPIKSENYNSKVCSLGNDVGKLFAVFILFRDFMDNKWRIKLSKISWNLILIGSLIMNLNVFIYLLPAYLVDTFYIL